MIDSLDPRFSRDAEYGRKTLTASFSDEDDNNVTFLIQVDYRVDSEGLRITELQYWPKNDLFYEQIHEHVRSVFS